MAFNRSHNLGTREKVGIAATQIRKALVRLDKAIDRRDIEDVADELWFIFKHARQICRLSSHRAIVNKRPARRS